MPSADPLVPAKSKKTRRGAKRRQKQDKTGGHEEQQDDGHEDCGHEDGGHAEQQPPKKQDESPSIVEGMEEYYHCRRTGCGFLATNSSWTSTVAAGGGQYWCPDPKLNCMRKYRAYPQMYAGQKLVKSKKVMVFKDPYKG